LAKKGAAMISKLKLHQWSADTPAKRVLGTLVSGMRGAIVVKEPWEDDIPGPVGGFVLEGAS
jgi:hypothetical protein